MRLVQRSSAGCACLIAVALAGCAPVSAPKGPAASGRSADAILSGPVDVAVDGGLVYVADGDGHAIRQLDLATKRLTTLVTSVPLSGPHRIQVDSDHTLLVGDVSSIVRIAPADGRSIVLAGWQDFSAADHNGTIGSVTSDRRGGAYVSFNHDIVRIDGATRAITPVAGKKWVGDGPPPSVTSGDGGPASAAELGDINALVTDASGHLYVSQSGDTAGADRIRRIDAVSGRITTVVGPDTPVRRAAGIETGIVFPTHMAFDGRGGLVFCEARGILRLDLATGQVTVVSTSQGKHGGWAGLAVAADGGLIVADYLPNRVRRIDPVSGRGRVLAGQGPPRPRIEL